MESRSDVVIVSAHGKGLWLAFQLVSQGISVAYVDVSDRIGRWTFEDWEGPFGFFKTPELDKSQWDHWSGLGNHEEVEQGYTFWLPSGPLEMRGPLFDFISRRNGIREEVVEYLRGFDRLEDSHKKALSKFIEKSHADGVWPALYAHQVGSTRYQMDRHRLTTPSPLRLFSPFYIRHLTAESIEGVRQRMVDSKINYYPHARIEDLSFAGRRLDAIEVSSDHSGIVSGRHFVWMLTSEETKSFPERVQSPLYPKGVLSSSWCWLRYEIDLSEGPEQDVLPNYFVLAKDMHLPWTHANVCLVKRSLNRRRFYTWVRVASARRFSRTYLTEMAQLIVTSLKERLPALEINIEGMPAEYSFSTEELGAPRWPVFSEAKGAFVKAQFKNVHYGSSEEIPMLVRSEQYGLQKELFKKIVSIEAELKKKTEVRSDSEIHPI
jgi:hypothetical protein